MISLLYQSDSAIPIGSLRYYSEMAALLAQCIDNNAPRRITGVLALFDDRFVQVIEGPDNIVERLFDRIVDDPRHRDVRLISRKVIDERHFGHWSMAFIGPPIDAAPVFDLLDSAGDGAAAAHDDLVALLAARIAT